MRNKIRLVVAATCMLPATVFGADLQQVAATGCCNMKDCVQNHAGHCQSCQSGANCNAYGYTYGGHCHSCQNGYCSGADVCRAYCDNWCHQCGPIGTAAQLHIPGAKALIWCANTKAAPDAGFAPPARTPIYHTGGGFGSWYGNQGPFAGGAPMVYQPTDTAQLGFSYANTPYWRPNPNRIPPVPQPSMFHNRMYVPRHQAHLHGNVYGGAIGHPLQGAACPVPVHPVSAPTDAQGNPPAAPAVTLRPMPYGPPQRAAQQQPAVTNSFVATPPAAVRMVSNTSAAAGPHAAPRSTVRRSSRPNTAARSQRRAPKKQSGGWFGLPSLSEIKF